MTADTAWHKSACILCENNCGIQIQADGRRFAKIRGDKEHAPTERGEPHIGARVDNGEPAEQFLNAFVVAPAEGQHLYRLGASVLVAMV
ncbi:hypothetical protein [Streptomyces sp. NPDC054808]